MCSVYIFTNLQPIHFLILCITKVIESIMNIIPKNIVNIRLNKEKYNLRFFTFMCTILTKSTIEFLSCI